MRVVVIGAGIGGLALAQALTTAGIEVAVHDRDPEISATGGYRLHLDRHACAALRRHLPPPLFQALLGSSAGPQAWRRFGILDHRLRLLAAEPRAEDDDALLIGRVPLRRLLAHGLPELRFGAEFTHHETHADGRVTAHFADGSTDRGDLLVGADGVGSRVATALAGRPTSAPVGLSGIAGRTPLTDEIRALVPDVLLAGPALAFSPDGVAVFLSVHDPAAGAVVDPAMCVQVPADVEPGDLVWGVNALDGRLPADVRRRDGAGLRTAALDLLGGWSPALRAIVAAQSRTVAHFRFHATDPDSDLTPWPSGVVTALGDAVHAMPPTGGRAAATAVRDADLLATRLAAAGAGTVPLAVQSYERDMPGHARDAVRESLTPVRWIRRLARPGLRGLSRAAFPVVAAAARVIAAR